MATIDVHPHDATLDARNTPRRTVLPRMVDVGAEVHLVADARPRYETVGQVGSGGIGEVVEAIDHDIGRRVALKRLRKDARGTVDLVRFAEEVRTTGRLEHPHIVPIHDVGVDENGDHFFVMKYVDGENLESLIARLAAGDRDAHARFPVARRLEIFVDLLQAVAFAHKNGIVHRDIKPANVMLGRHGEVLLMDWGIAKDMRASREARHRGDATPPTRRFETEDGSIVGTPAYMAPEQAQGLPTDERADVFALSVLLYELLTLTHPHARAGSTIEMLRAVVEAKIPSASAVAYREQDPIPAEVVWFLGRGLARDVEQRFQRVDEMLAWFAERARGRIQVDCPVTFVKRVTHGFLVLLDRRPFLATLALVGTAVSLVGSAAVAIAGVL